MQGDNTVHVIELFTADGVPYHKICFKCSHCNGILAMSRYSSMDGVLYCKPHFEQRFKETGTVRHVICVWHCPFSTVRHEEVLV
ncbi:hypothetical protein SO802_033930 [Lithocarpus litseifolius]|uniref:LIM zinc-binding domain-containing protein n=1 Tax=Lithocarpus litseifolius TaxID=425828 RepID=A0AAW2BJU8_9ROSI